MACGGGPLPGEKVFVVDDGVSLDGSEEALTAEFRHMLGLLPEEDADLTEAFKARIGLLGPAGEQINEVQEMEVQWDETREETLAQFKMVKFAKSHFINGNALTFTTDPLKGPLLSKSKVMDKTLSLPIWLAIQRFMGDSERPDVKKKTKIPVMTAIFKNLELLSKNRRLSADMNPDDHNNNNGPLKKRSSWKKFFRSDSVNTDPSSGRKSSVNAEPMDIATLMHSVPLDDLDLIHFIVGHGILRKELRDEIYCQLCRQVTKNPSKDNTLRGWILFALCAGCFLPSDKLGPFLRSFWREASADYKDYATYIVRTLRRTSANGMRYHPPNWLEYQATKVKKYVILPVHIPDGSIQSLEADSSTTSSEMIQKVTRMMNIKDSFGFSVYICIFDKVSSLGSGLDHIMDAITECEQIVRQKGKTEDAAPWRLYFRKELFTPWHDPELDAIASNLIYKQICKGVKVDEYRFKSEEELSRFAARRLYIEDGCDVIPGKLQSNLHEYLPERALNDGKNREGWTQAILAAFNAQGFSTKLVPQKQVQWHVIATAPRKWPVQFSGLFEATVLASPVLPRTDAVIAVSSKGFFVLDDALNVLVAYHFYEIVEVFFQKAHKTKPGTFTILSVKGSEFTCASHNAETIAKILRTFIEGLRRRSRWAVGLQDFTMEDHSDKYATTLNFQLADVIELLNESEINEKTKKEDWLYGRCERTKQKGQFPLDAVYVLPTYERPPLEFLNLFVSMSMSETNTLPKKRGVVVISQGTIGRHGAHGLDTSA